MKTRAIYKSAQSSVIVCALRILRAKGDCYRSCRAEAIMARGTKRISHYLFRRMPRREWCTCAAMPINKRHDHKIEHVQSMLQQYPEAFKNIDPELLLEYLI